MTLTSRYVAASSKCRAFRQWEHKRCFVSWTRSIFEDCIMIAGIPRTALITL